MDSYSFHDSATDNKNNIQNYIQDAFIAKQEKSALDSEITIPMFLQESHYIKEELITSEDDYMETSVPILQQECYIKEEFMISESDFNDIDDKSKFQIHVEDAFIMNQQENVTFDYDEFNVETSEQEFYVKEEPMISDADLNNFDEEVTDVSSSKDEEIMSNQKTRGVDSNGHVYNSEVTNNINEMNEDNHEIDGYSTVCVEGPKESASKKQTSILNFFKKSLPKEKETGTVVSNFVTSELKKNRSKVSVKRSLDHTAKTSTAKKRKIDSQPEDSMSKKQKLTLEPLKTCSVRIEKLPEENADGNVKEIRASDANNNAHDTITPYTDDKAEQMPLKCADPSFYCSDDCDYCTRMKKNIPRDTQVHHSSQINRNVLLECKKCCGKYKDKKSLHSHMRLCGLDTFLKCDYCEYRTRYAKSLKPHLQSKHKTVKEEEIKMIVNRAWEITRQVVGRELKSNTTTTDQTRQSTQAATEFSQESCTKLYCSSCDMTFSECSSYKKSKCPQCDERILFQCSKCERRYESRYGIKNHVKNKCYTDYFKPNFKCADCDFNAKVKHNLLRHIQRKHCNIDLKDYEKCTLCSKTFKIREDRLSHEKLCAKRIPCEFCSYRTSNRGFFLKHVLNSHILRDTQDKGVTKHKDPDTTGAGSFVLKPMSKAENLLIQQLVIGYCSKCKEKRNFFVLAGRQWHCQKCETKFTYHCGVCEKTYKHLYLVREHIVAKHLFAKLKKRHQCLRCKKKYLLAHSLKWHIKMCGRPNLHCDHCKFTTKNKTSLVTHIWKLHADALGLEPMTLPAKIYNCDVCDKKYSRPQNLSNHKRKHCGNKPTLYSAMTAITKVKRKTR